VLSVVIFHANEDLIGGGFIGVDIFFVISGYLITGILARENAAGSFSLAGFYRRRVRRLFPALFVVLAVTLAMGWFLLQPADYAELGRTTISTIFFVSNFDFLELTGYFGGEARMKPLLHTWSLAVEEQFYIVFPLLLAAIWRFGKGGVVWILAALGLASLAASSITAFTAPSAAFYLAPSRAFELMIGALIALNAFPAPSEKVRGHLAMLGLALIVISLAAIDDDTPFPGVAALGPCVGTGLMIYAGKHGPTRAGAWISNPVFVFFGAISYSLYLWHWPLLVYARQWSFGEPPGWLALAAVAVAIAAAWISYRFIEQPFLRGKAKADHVLAIGAAAMAVGVAIAVTPLLTQGFPQRFSPQARALFASAEDFNPRRRECHQRDDRINPYAENCTFGASAPPSLVVWGDSHGAELVVAVGERLAARGASAMEITASACPPALGYQNSSRALCRQRNDTALREIVGDARVTTVVMIASYSGYDDEEWPIIERGMERAVRELRAAGKRVVVVSALPIMPNDPPSALGMMSARRLDIAHYGVTRTEHDARNVWSIALMRKLEAQGAIVVDSALILCDAQFCPAYRAPLILYFNRTHVSLAGARLIAARIPLD
jgi:peptidoglycan/LPS O-acetylase OafA/YrhL